MNEQLNKLRKAKKKLSEIQCKQMGHSYGEWSKKGSNESIIYERTCNRCSQLEEIKSSSSILEIETEIMKQNKGKQLLDYLLNSSIESLTKENLLFYIFVTKDYMNYIDKNILKEILVKYNQPSIDAIDEYTLLKKFSDNIYNVSDDIWDDIYSYISDRYKEEKGSTLK